MWFRSPGSRKVLDSHGVLKPVVWNLSYCPQNLEFGTYTEQGICLCNPNTNRNALIKMKGKQFV